MMDLIRLNPMREKALKRAFGLFEFSTYLNVPISADMSRLAQNGENPAGFPFQPAA